MLIDIHVGHLFLAGVVIFLISRLWEGDATKLLDLASVLFCIDGYCLLDANVYRNDKSY